MATKQQITVSTWNRFIVTVNELKVQVTFINKLRIRGERLTGKWFDQHKNLLYKRSITIKYNIWERPSILDSDKTNIFTCCTSHQEKQKKIVCGLLFSRVDLVLMKSCRSEKNVLSIKLCEDQWQWLFFKFFYPIHLQLRSSRWHFIIKQLLILIRPPSQNRQIHNP